MEVCLCDAPDVQTKNSGEGKPYKVCAVCGHYFMPEHGSGSKSYRNRMQKSGSRRARSPVLNSLIRRKS
jgi:hypothetical protein